MSSTLLARFAENAFWMARQMERVENVARLLDVNETFARDRHGAQDWLPIIELHADRKNFFTRNTEATANAVVAYYITDRDNPSSIISTVRAARDNARSIRHLISTEMWTHLNMFYNQLNEIERTDLDLSHLSRLCARIKEQCQTHTGLIEGTYYRDQSWYFYRIGKSIERADQTTRLLDIRYHGLLAEEEGELPMNTSQWNAVLRSAAGYHAFRRVYPRGMQPRDVAGFLLFNSGFPRSVWLCVSETHDMIIELRRRYGLERHFRVDQPLEELRFALESQGIQEILTAGLHEFLDWTQLCLIRLSNGLGSAYFGHMTDENSPAETANGV